MRRRWRRGHPDFPMSRRHEVESHTPTMRGTDQGYEYLCPGELVTEDDGTQHLSEMHPRHWTRPQLRWLTRRSPEIDGVKTLLFAEDPAGPWYVCAGLRVTDEVVATQLALTSTDDDEPAIPDAPPVDPQATEVARIAARLQ